MRGNLGIEAISVCFYAVCFVRIQGLGVKKQYWVAWLLSAVGFAFASSHPSEKPLPDFFTQPHATAKVLGWRAVPVTRQNACGGYYWEPPSLRASAAQAKGKPVITHIASQGPAVLRSNGVSVLNDHVLLTQPGRMVWADRATLYRNGQGRIIKIIAVGHVHVFEQGQLSVTPRMVLKIREDTLHATQVVYRVRGLQAKVQQGAFGRAFSVKRDAQHVWFLRHATYSTCAPTHPAWLIHAKRLRLDSKAQKGKAHQLWLSVKGIPIFYAPYWSFALGSHTRKTGFLAPSWVHDSRSGTGLRLPFYWNMAPNHDMLLTTTYETRRHWLLEDRFRWLTRHTQGNFSFNWLPKDAAFAAFKQNSLNQVPADPAMQPYATALQGMGTSRYFAQGTWSWLWGRHGSAFLQLARVSDPYYLRDVGWTYVSTSSDQLLSQLQLHYRTMHWQSDWAALDFQTLHTPDQPTLQDAYSMLAWDLAGFYAGPAHLNWQWQSQVARFQLSSGGREGRPDGNRMHLRPGVAWVHQHASWYWTPQLQWDATAYQLQHGAGGASSQGNTRALPIFDVDAGWYGMRHMQWRDHDVWASVHPRVRYLYVPYQNQSGLPDFDAQALPFTAAQIFSNNRYVGYDRMMNANQLS
jgi:LPS-assembly protein